MNAYGLFLGAGKAFNWVIKLRDWSKWQRAHCLKGSAVAITGKSPTCCVRRVFQYRSSVHLVMLRRWCLSFTVHIGVCFSMAFASLSYTQTPSSRMHWTLIPCINIIWQINVFTNIARYKKISSISLPSSSPPRLSALISRAPFAAFTALTPALSRQRVNQKHLYNQTSTTIFPYPDKNKSGADASRIMSLILSW